jgi:cell division protein FtsZ
VQASEKAINSPLLEASMDGAHGVLLAISGGSDLGLFEINEAASLVQEAAHPEANIIFGTVIDDSLGDEVRVTVIAAGFDGGTPTHKKLDPPAFGSGSTTSTATADAGHVGSGQRDTTAERPGGAANGAGHQASQPAGEPAQQPSAAPRPTAGGTPAPAYRHTPHTDTQQQDGTQQNHSGSLPGRALPVTEEPEDEVDVPPFMRN